MRHLTTTMTLLAIACLLAGCGEESTERYVSKRGDYTFEYPRAWRVMDDDRELTSIRKEINKSGETPMPFEINPDVVFVGNERLGGLVVVSPLPIFSPGNAPDNEESLLDAFLAAGSGVTGIRSVESATRIIRGKSFRVDVVPAAQAAVSLSALCLHNNHIYMFQWSCDADKFDKWRPIFEKSLESISFDDADVTAVQQAQASDKAGFLTGLWHGALFPFRAMAAIFWQIDVYSDSASSWYLWGFIAGMLPWASSALGRARRAR